MVGEGFGRVSGGRWFRRAAVVSMHARGGCRVWITGMPLWDILAYLEDTLASVPVYLPGEAFFERSRAF